MGKRVWVFWFAFLIGILSSCSQISTVKNLQLKEPAVLQPKTEKFGNYTFIMPVNFQLKEDLSVVYEDDGVYRAYLVFVGKSSINKLINFFDKYMSKAGWKKESSLVGEEAIVAYSRNGQLIIFKIQEILGLTYVKTLLTTK